MMLDRRSFFTGSGAALALRARGTADADARVTHVYKTVDGHGIKADVYSPASMSLPKPRPVLVWIHGGALINGHREGITEPVKRWAFSEAGYTLVSVDYRLAPETQLPEIIGDVEDAFRWIRREGPRLFGADPDRIAVAGGSAGGYLTLVTGYRVKPRPRVLLSLWGYGDLIGPWYSGPSPHARHQQIKMTREEAFAQVRGPVVSDSRDRKGNGGAFYQHCRQHGIWPTAVSGWDPRRDAAKFYPYMPLKNVTKEYPPTVMMHGTADTDVPYEQSALMRRELERHQVRHELITIPNAEHGLPDGDRAFVAAAYGKAFEFIAGAMRG